MTGNGGALGLRVPVYLKVPRSTPPAAPVYYLVAANGVFLVRTNPLFTATIAVAAGVPGLARHQSRLVLRLPRVPSALVERTVGFFRAAYERWGGEAIVIVFFAPAAPGKAPRWVLDAPPQVLAGRFDRGRFRADLRLEYGACARPGAEFVKLGTIHSHGPAAAGHSHVDVDDERDETGLHVTIGRVTKRVPEFTAAFVVGGVRFTVPAERVLAPFHAARRPPTVWMDRIVVGCERRTGDESWGGEGRAGCEGSHDG